MKKIFLILVFHISLISISVCQKVNYQDLIGTSWTYSKMPVNDSISFVFMDSSHYSFYYWKDNTIYFDAAIMNYSLDTSYNPTLWFFGSYKVEKDGEIQEYDGVYAFIKFIDKNTIEATTLKNGDRPKKDKVYNTNALRRYYLIRTE